MGLADHLQSFRGRRDGPDPDDRFARRLWDLAGIAERYYRFVERFEPVAEGSPTSLAPLDAFGLRLALVIEYLEVAWDDPQLPSEVLPDEWPGGRARGLAKRLYEALLPLAVEYAEGVLQLIRAVSASR